MVKFDFNKTPITQIADYIIVAAAKANASDIHFDPREDGMIVRFRIDGELQDYTFISKTYEKNLATRLKLLANMNITETRLPQDGAIKGKIGDLDLDIRVSSLPLNEGEKIVLRILDYSRSLEGLDKLGFNAKNLEKLKRMIQVPNGIILITGATGSGKSTTVYSILQTLNKEETNIVTVEDPIEMSIEGLNQVQLNSEIGMTFSKVLRSVLRQDPNIILIGEIRDPETAKIAVRSSITGHLVLSTVHTNNALATVERLLDMGVERYLLSTALTGIISQRLAKRICPKCCIERDTTDYEKKLLKKFLNKDVEKVHDVNENGCDECHHGYKGRIAIQEVLEFDDDIRNALNEEELKKEQLKNLVYTDKVITMLQDALGKVVDGITSFDEVYRIIEIDDVDSLFTNDNELSSVSSDDSEPETLNFPTFTNESNTEVKKEEKTLPSPTNQVQVVPPQSEPVNNDIKVQPVQVPANQVKSVAPAVQPVQVTPNPNNQTSTPPAVAALGTEVEDDKKVQQVQQPAQPVQGTNIQIPIVEQEENTQ